MHPSTGVPLSHSCVILRIDGLFDVQRQGRPEPLRGMDDLRPILRIRDQAAEFPAPLFTVHLYRREIHAGRVTKKRDRR